MGFHFRLSDKPLLDTCNSKKFRDTPLENQRQHKLNQSQSGHYKHDEDNRERSCLREIAVFNEAENRHSNQIPPTRDNKDHCTDSGHTTDETVGKPSEKRRCNQRQQDPTKRGQAACAQIGRSLLQRWIYLVQ